MQGPWGKGAYSGGMGKSVLLQHGKGSLRNEGKNGYSKGTTKGNTLFYGQCHHCGEWGHTQNGCPQKESFQKPHQKGKGRGKPTHSTHNVEEGQAQDHLGLGRQERHTH